MNNHKANISLKVKTRERVQPKMGKVDIDYQELHDAIRVLQVHDKTQRYNFRRDVSIHLSRLCWPSSCLHLLTFPLQTHAYYCILRVTETRCRFQLAGVQNVTKAITPTPSYIADTEIAPLRDIKANIPVLQLGKLPVDTHTKRWSSRTKAELAFSMALIILQMLLV